MDVNNKSIINYINITLLFHIYFSFFLVCDLALAELVLLPAMYFLNSPSARSEGYAFLVASFKHAGGSA